jgi:glyoxylase-like metal-dependent hydrolase (beta-lactamase superfamily II)
MARKMIIGAAIGLGCLVVLGVAGYAFVMDQFKDVAPGETVLVDGLGAVIKVNGANMYLVRGQDGLIAFDAGDSVDAVTAGLRRLGIDPLDVKALFLTHSDYDHVAGISLFPNAAVYLPAAEEPYIEGRRKRRIFGFFDSKNSLPVQGYEILQPSQAIDACGLKIASMPVPGHTAGSTAYLVNGILVTGDALLLKGGKAIRPIAAFTEDMKTAERSIASLASMPGIAFICTGHTGYSVDPAAALQAWRAKED